DRELTEHASVQRGAELYRRAYEPSTKTWVDRELRRTERAQAFDVGLGIAVATSYRFQMRRRRAGRSRHPGLVVVLRRRVGVGALGHAAEGTRAPTKNGSGGIAGAARWTIRPSPLLAGVHFSGRNILRFGIEFTL